MRDASCVHRSCTGCGKRRTLVHPGYASTPTEKSGITAEALVSAPSRWRTQRHSWRRCSVLVDDALVCVGAHRRASVRRAGARLRHHAPGGNRAAGLLGRLLCKSQGCSREDGDRTEHAEQGLLHGGLLEEARTDGGREPNYMAGTEGNQGRQDAGVVRARLEDSSREALRAFQRA
jgi:hypothetical protein